MQACIHPENIVTRILRKCVVNLSAGSCEFNPTVRLSFFALPLREMIHYDIIRVLKTLGEGHVAQIVG